MGETDYIIRIPMRWVAVVTVSLPFGAFISCIYLSVKYHFEESTETHCGVPNYLPSISSAIGSFSPQGYIWRSALALHSAPRFLVAAMYYRFNSRVLPNYKSYQRMVKLATLLNVVENIALLGLSFVSSKENYGVHKGFFITFIFCSEVYMLLTYFLLKDNLNRLTTSNEKLAFRRKKQLLVVNIGCFLIALYFFYRHNTYCEEGIYTMFALFEYIVVLSNMGFHMAAYYDFYHHHLTVGEVKLISS